MSKFNNPGDEFVYDLTLDTSNLDDECGEQDTTGWYGSLWFAPSDLDALHAAGVPEDAGYAIVLADSLGFVYVDYFSSHSEWETAWSRIRAEIDALDEDDS